MRPRSVYEDWRDPSDQRSMTREEIRLAESNTRKKHWKRWGPYLSERAWGTVREDYSPDGTAWEFFPPMIMLAHVPIVGMKMVSLVLVIGVNSSALRLRCGTSAIPS